MLYSFYQNLPRTSIVSKERMRFYGMKQNYEDREHPRQQENAQITEEHEISHLDINYLKQLFRESGFTQAQLAELTGVSPSTVTKVLGGSCKSPSYYVIASMIKALGGSLDVLAHIATTPAGETELVRLYREMLHDERRRSNAKTIVICALVAFIIAVLLIDIATPGFGFITKALHIGSVFDNLSQLI